MEGMNIIMDTSAIIAVLVNEPKRQKIIETTKGHSLIEPESILSIEDMDIPGWRLHSLKGDHAGLWAVNVSGNWRVVFEFEDGHAYVVNYEDYH